MRRRPVLRAETVSDRHLMRYPYDVVEHRSAAFTDTFFETTPHRPRGEVIRARNASPPVKSAKDQPLHLWPSSQQQPEN
jgi:hypothetical protein